MERQATPGIVRLANQLAETLAVGALQADEIADLRAHITRLEAILTPKQCGERGGRRRTESKRPPTQRRTTPGA